MKRYLYPLLLLSLIGLAAGCGVTRKSTPAQKERTVHILAVNDMHATVENFPRLAYMADSLRSVYPDLILVSAGDNQTGDPINDQYAPKGYPMIALMNHSGFEFSAVGNHEFDTGQQGFALLTQKAQFPFVCANVTADPALGIKLLPYYKKTLPNGLKLIFTSVLAINDKSGIPDSHPDNVKGFSFENHLTAADRLLSLRDSCDLLVYVNHAGIENDTVIAERFPHAVVPLIIGGHSHTRIEQPVYYNGIMITQAERRLKYATLIEVTVAPNGTATPRMQLLPVGKEGNRDPHASAMVEDFQNNNPTLTEQIAHTATGFQGEPALGYLSADALCAEEHADLAFVNAGNVRIDHLDAGSITGKDIYKLDPFGNELVCFTLTGEEVLDLYYSGFRDDGYHYLYSSSGIKVQYYQRSADTVERIELFNEDGTPFDLNKTYKVVINSYMASAFSFKHQDPGTGLFRPSAETIINYLRKIKEVPDYNSVERMKVEMVR